MSPETTHAGTTHAGTTRAGTTRAGTTHALDAAPTSSGSPSVQLCTFHVDHLLVGIEVGRVQEVVRHQPTTPVPLAPPEIEGLINLRGQIVTAIDLRRLLELPPREGEARPMNAVVRLDGEAVSLLVDRADEVVEMPADALAPVPATAPDRVREVFTGTYRLPAHLLLVLEPDRLVALDPAARDTRRSA